MSDDNAPYWTDADDDDHLYDDDASGDYDGRDTSGHVPPFVDEAGADDDYFAVHTFDSAALDDESGIDEDDDIAAPPAPRPRRAGPEPAIGAHGSAPALSMPLQRAPVYTPRRTRRRAQQPTPAWWVTLRTLVVVAMTAVIVSTVFSLWTRPDFFTDEFRAGLNQVQATQRVLNIQPSPLPTESRTVRIGIVAGHSGRPEDESFETDPGAVCPDGLTELSINQAVAREVVAGLRRLEYEVDLLEEFDPLLQGYQADVLVSVHTNDCQDYGAAGTGFSAASASARQTTRGEDEFLLECLIDRYGKTTGLPQHGGLTYDMTDYHTFAEVSSDTPTAIIELGFMNRDRLMLTTQQPLLAQGIINGILCFLEAEDLPAP